MLLGSHVLIAPLYPPVQLARALTTIDLVSGGRLLPGFGIGWSPEEYRAAGVEFTRRGARMDELLDALEAIWTEDPAQYQGAQLSVPAAPHAPEAGATAASPFYLGALSERALRRVARRADGWLPVCVVPGDSTSTASSRSALCSTNSPGRPAGNPRRSTPCCG